MAVYDPMITELIGAAESLGYQVEKDQINDGARFPKRPHIKSGYIMISKKEKKTSVVNQIAKEMFQARQQKR